MNRPDPDIDTKVRNTVRCLNETIQSNANEPSLALYRIQVNWTIDTICFLSSYYLNQEHIQKNLPVMVQKRYELIGFQERLNGFVFDIEYGVDAVRDMGTSTEHIHVCRWIEVFLFFFSSIRIFLEYYCKSRESSSNW